MITLAEVEKLGRVHAVEPIVLSVYLNVPWSPAELPGLPARVDELVAAGERDAGRSGHLRQEDRRSARDEAALAGPDWLGQRVAVFACAGVGLLEIVGLPEASGAPERAVLGIRPHIRPLLAALQPGPRLTAEILAESAGALAAIGLPACLAAVNTGAVETLVVPYEGRVPGYECGRCGALGLAADCCPDWGTAALPVPDLIEEMVSRTLEDDGQVLVVHDAPGRIAARMPRLHRQPARSTCRWAAGLPVQRPRRALNGSLHSLRSGSAPADLTLDLALDLGLRNRMWSDSFVSHPFLGIAHLRFYA